MVLGGDVMSFSFKFEFCFQKRLGNESMCPYDAYALCLQKARDPVACEKGHLFCRECVLTDLCT